MRLRNIHEPQSGVDVTTVPTERQTQTLRRHSDPITPLRLRHVDDDGRHEEVAPDNATTDDEDYHTQRKTGQGHAAAHAASVDDAATTQTATPPSTKFQTTMQKTARTVGRPHSESNAQS